MVYQSIDLLYVFSPEHVSLFIFFHHRIISLLLVILEGEIQFHSNISIGDIDWVDEFGEMAECGISVYSNRWYLFHPSKNKIIVLFIIIPWISFWISTPDDGMAGCLWSISFDTHGEWDHELVKSKNILRLIFQSSWIF